MYNYNWNSNLKNQERTERKAMINFVRYVFVVGAFVALTSVAHAQSQSCAALAYSRNAAWASQTWVGENACVNASSRAVSACHQNGGVGCGYLTTGSSSKCMAVVACSVNGVRNAYGAFGANAFEAESNAFATLHGAGWTNCHIRVSWCPYGENLE